MLEMNIRSKRAHSPAGDRLKLIRVLTQVREPVLEVIVQWQVETPGHSRGTNTQHRATGINNTHVPGFAAVVRGAVWPDEGLALVLIHQVQGDFRVVCVEGVGVHEEIEDCREDGYGAAVDIKVHAG